MKMKKLLSLMLCLSMLMTTVLTGCGKKSSEEEEGQEEAATSVDLVTLNMFIVTDDETTDEQKKAVEIAINEYTIKSLKTKININYLKEEEYWPTIEQTLADIEAYEEDPSNKKMKSKSAPKTRSLDEIYTEMRTNGVGIDMILPKVGFGTPMMMGAVDAFDITVMVPQVDIIVFNSYDKYYEYAIPGMDEDGKAIPSKLAPLDSYLKAESKILNSYIYPAYLEAAKLGGKNIYGIPVNGPIGTYEYIAIDRELAQKYITSPDMLTRDAFETDEEYNEYFDAYVTENFNTFPEFAPFLAKVKAGEPDVIPLNRGTSPGNVEFYPEEGSPIGVVFESYEWSKVLHSVYEDESVRDHFESIYNYRQAGYMADENTPDNARYAIQIVEGSTMAEEALEAKDGRDYIFITYKYPKFVNEKVLEGVFAISAKSYNKDRAMEVIEAFNTKPALANLLQWGVEDGTSTYIPEGSDEPMEGNYKLDEDQTVVLIDDGNGYKMNNNLTGNKYIKYRLSGTLDEFEGQKLQNTQSWVGAFSGYAPVYNMTDEEANKKIEDEVEKFSRIGQKYYADFLAGTGDRPFNERYDELINTLNEEADEFKMLFADRVYYAYSGAYERFVRSMIEGGSYTYGRIAGLEPPVEETEEAVEGDEATEGEAEEAETPAEGEAAEGTEAPAEGEATAEAEAPAEGEATTEAEATAEADTAETEEAAA